MAASTAPLTAQQRTAIQRGVTVFQDGVNAMNSVYNEVFDAGEHLRGQAMVSTAGAQFGSAIDRWVEDFNNIKSLLQAMADQLQSTTDQTMSTNQANQEMIAAMNYAPPSFTG